VRVLDEERPSCWLDRRTVNTTLLWIPTAFPVDVFASQEKRVERRYTVYNGSLNKLLQVGNNLIQERLWLVRECDFHLGLFLRDLYSTVYGLHDFRDLGCTCQPG
jgi:hypothetical protein